MSRCDYAVRRPKFPECAATSSTFSTTTSMVPRTLSASLGRALRSAARNPVSTTLMKAKGGAGIHKRSQSQVLLVILLQPPFAFILAILPFSFVLY